MLMSAELKGWVTRFIYFVNLFYVRYNCQVSSLLNVCDRFLGRGEGLFCLHSPHSGAAHFFISNTFISNVRLKLASNQGNANQQPEAELLLFENYTFSSFKLPFKNNTNKTYSKN